VTTTTQTFIEPSDIIAVRLECNKCHATMTSPISSGMIFERLKFCHNCGQSLLTLQNDTVVPKIEKCAQAIIDASKELKEWHRVLASNGSKGFTITLELAQPPEE
jgi:DNA replicative helicase MCM subunit Mcm2 (Cdc46/Mcm family)